MLIGPYFQGDIVASYDRLARRYGHRVAAHASARGYLRESIGGSQGAHSRRLAVSTDLDVRWENVGGVVVVPYLFESGGFSAGEEAVIESAMADIATRTNGLFSFAIRGVEQDYILFKRGINEDECFSHVGRVGVGEQILSLTNKCLGFGFVQHEILHALGFWHEQSRSDRDSHVTVFDRNVQLGRDEEFAKEATGSGNSPYDYGSVMHSSATEFGQVKQTCTTQDFCRRRGSIRFLFDGPLGTQLFCLVPESAPAAGIRVDFFPCDNLPPGVTTSQWDVLDVVDNTEGSLIRHTSTTLCLSMRDIGNGIFGGQLPLELQVCPTGLGTNEQVKHMHFYFSNGLTAAKLSSTEIRPYGDPFLCLDHANTVLETTVCASTASISSNFQLWEFSGDVPTTCAGVQLDCSYVKTNDEFEFHTTIDAPQAIGQRNTASNEDINQLVAFYTALPPLGSNFQVQTDSITIGCSAAGAGLVLIVAVILARRRSKRRRRRRRREELEQALHLSDGTGTPRKPRRKSKRSEAMALEAAKEFAKGLEKKAPESGFKYQPKKPAKVASAPRAGRDQGQQARAEGKKSREVHPPPPRPRKAKNGNVAKEVPPGLARNQGQARASKNKNNKSHVDRAASVKQPKVKSNGSKGHVNDVKGRGKGNHPPTHKTSPVKPKGPQATQKQAKSKPKGQVKSVQRQSTGKNAKVRQSKPKVKEQSKKRPAQVKKNAQNAKNAKPQPKKQAKAKGNSGRGTSPRRT